MSTFKGQSLTVKILSLAFIAVIGVLGCALFFAIMDSKAAFQKEKEKSIHYLIDEIDNSYIYLVIHNGDTLGPVAIPK
jgi:hypothetical protein